MERFAWLSGQKEERIQRDRVTTLEVACERYEELVGRMERMKAKMRRMERQVREGGGTLEEEEEGEGEGEGEGQGEGQGEEGEERKEGRMAAVYGKASLLDAALQRVEQGVSQYAGVAMAQSSVLSASTLILCSVSLTTSRNVSCNRALFHHSGWQEHEVIGKVSGPVQSILSRHALSSLQCGHDLQDRPPVRLTNGAVVPMKVYQQREEVEVGLLRLITGEVDRVEVRWRTGVTDGRVIEMKTMVTVVWGDEEDGQGVKKEAGEERKGRGRSLKNAEMLFAMQPATMVTLGIEAITEEKIDDGSMCSVGGE